MTMKDGTEVTEFSSNCAAILGIRFWAQRQLPCEGFQQRYSQGMFCKAERMKLRE